MTRPAEGDILSLKGDQDMRDKAKQNATYQRYHEKYQYRTQLLLHKVNDKEIIDYIAQKRSEGISPTQLFKEWYKEMVK